MNIINHFIKIHSVFRYAARFAPVANYQEALNLITHNRIKAEKIGEWLYCFTTAIIGVQLQAIGFWYSFKHDAYIYNGSNKEGYADWTLPH